MYILRRRQRVFGNHDVCSGSIASPIGLWSAADIGEGNGFSNGIQRPAKVAENWWAVEDGTEDERGVATAQATLPLIA